MNSNCKSTAAKFKWLVTKTRICFTFSFIVWNVVHDFLWIRLNPLVWRVSSPQRVLVSAIIHFFMVFLLLTFMYDKNKAPLLTLPFQVSSSLFHSNLNWPSNVTSNNPFTLVVPGIFQIFHTCTHLVFRWISFLASGRYCPSRESKRENVKACAYLVKKL